MAGSKSVVDSLQPIHITCIMPIYWFNCDCTIQIDIYIYRVEA